MMPGSTAGEDARRYWSACKEPRPLSIKVKLVSTDFTGPNGLALPKPAAMAKN